MPSIGGNYMENCTIEFQIVFTCLIFLFALAQKDLIQCTQWKMTVVKKHIHFMCWFWLIFFFLFIFDCAPKNLNSGMLNKIVCIIRFAKSETKNVAIVVSKTIFQSVCACLNNQTTSQIGKKRNPLNSANCNKTKQKTNTRNVSQRKQMGFGDQCLDALFIGTST